jgi:hypothetical protein
MIDAVDAYAAIFRVLALAGLIIMAANTLLLQRNERDEHTD